MLEPHFRGLLMAIDRMKSENFQQPLHLQEMHFETYIQPLLKRKASGLNLRYLFYLGYIAWRNGVKREDIVRVKAVLNIYEQMLKERKDKLVEILKAMNHEQFATAERTWVKVKDHEEMTDTLEEFVGRFGGHYQALFENEFRLHVSAVYYHLCRVYQVKDRNLVAEDATGEQVINMPASKKFSFINGRTVATTQFGNPAIFVEGFDNKVRNSLDGHHRWTVVDGKIKLVNVNSENGSVNWEKVVEKDHLKALLKQARRTVWSLEAATAIFLHDHPELITVEYRKDEYSSEEMKAAANTLAEDCCFELEEMKIDDSKRIFEFSFTVPVNVPPIEEQIFTPTGGYDIYHKRHDQLLKRRAYRFLFIFSEHFNVEKMDKITLNFSYKETPIGSVAYDGGELKVLATEDGMNGKVEPTPVSGVMPHLVFPIFSPVRIPIGIPAALKKMMIDELEKHKDEDDV